MTEAVANLAAQGVASAGSERGAVGLLVRKVFVAMHGAYGSLFVSKFATGERDSAGKDKGVRTAMMVWDGALREFPEDVVEAAVKRCQQEHPEYPPSLPQFLAICKSVMPRKDYFSERGIRSLPAPQEARREPVGYVPKADGKDWARQIIGRHDAGERIKPGVLSCARKALRIPVGA